jgi:xanthine dehydrogenase accessory factor
MGFPQQQFLEHAEEVLDFALVRLRSGKPCALCVITDVSGGSAREVGTIIAICGEGEMAGYVSNGCIDADLRLQALASIAEGAVKEIIYGVGSPYVDLRLPCGGTVKLLIDPAPDLELCETAAEILRNRQRLALQFDHRNGLMFSGQPLQETGWNEGRFIAVHTPQLRLFAAGSGAPLFAVTRVCSALGLPLVVATPDPNDAAMFAAFSGVSHITLDTPASPPALPIDRWSAVLLLFHAHEWETALIAGSLQHHPFYIGALGSPRTHQTRLSALRDIGVREDALKFIRGPIGTIPSARDAGTLAVSVLAEIIAEYRAQKTALRTPQFGLEPARVVGFA